MTQRHRGSTGPLGWFLSPGPLLAFIIFWSTLDRSMWLPLVTGVSEDLGASISAGGLAITLHALAYSLMQLIWGPLSARWGRVRVLVVSTALAGAANLVVSLAPDMTVFTVARVVSGGTFAATFAAVLTYIGDTLPLERRPAVMSNLATATALGLSLGVLGAGTVAMWVSWRWVFAAFAVFTLALVPAIQRLPDPPGHRAERVGEQLAALVRNRWAGFLYALTALEGALLIGVYNFLPIALQQAGESVFTSGLVTAAFGVAVVVVSQLMKLFVSRTRPRTVLGIAGAFATAAFVALTGTVTAGTVLVGASLMGVAWALGHTTLQTWMTDAAHDARALGMTFFSISLMLGGSLGAAGGSLAAEHDAFGVLFAVSIVGSAVFAFAAAVGASRYRTREAR